MELVDNLHRTLVLQGVKIERRLETGEEMPRLGGVDFELKPGEWVNLVGVNGSGKSSLARLLAGLMIDGVEGTWDRGFAGTIPSPYVMQQPDAQLFAETPREEIRFALEWRGLAPEAIRGKSEEILRETGLQAIGDLTWDQLSGGQRQLTAVAAASAAKLPLIVFDEATSMLDEQSRESVRGIAAKLNREGTAVVWVTQRLQEIGDAERTVAMSSGRIFFDGNGGQFLYGMDYPQAITVEAPPCLACGLRLPYASRLALQLGREGRLQPPFPRAAEAWESILPVIAGEETARQSNNAAHESRAMQQTEQRRVGTKGSALTITGIRQTEAGASQLPDGRGTDGSTLQLHTGQITVLMGANGAGKTHLMERIAGLRNADGLAVYYGDEPLQVRRRMSIRNKFKPNSKAMLAYSYSCQSPEEQLFLRSVREELRYSLRPYTALTEQERTARIEEALRAVSWNSDWLERDPYEMSGGERRRTALACLFAPPAEWLLLDEPTAGLDADGHELLAAKLRQCAAGGQGILLISHESDWVCELADRFLLLRADGSVRSCDSMELVSHPHWLTEAGMDVPDWLRIAHRSIRLGVAPEQVWEPGILASALAGRPREPHSSELPAIPAAPTAHAAALAASTPTALDNVHADIANLTTTHQAAAGTEAGAASGGHSLEPESMWNPETLPRSSQLPSPAVAPAQARTPFAKRANAARPSPIAAFDARAVWLSYIVLSLFILQLTGWRGILLSLAFVAGAIYWGRIPLRRWRGAIKTITAFTIVISVFAGIDWQLSGDFWDGQAAMISLKSLIRPWIVMLLGFGLPIAVTPLRLRRSLEQLFVKFGRVPAWATKLLLTITLLLRFVPVLLAEWERFSRIAAARGKKASSTLRNAASRIRETALPFMLSLFRLGDQVTDALESRGVGSRNRRAVLVTEQWKTRDAFLLLACVAGGLLLHAIE
ncbi:ATP-binding cassette domain-containing protein [Paenibacillus sacheonensis]|uniref:ATP-binding cassette domain-containing protein n=1 Tax=Paenibacillus sacheonensis TaxID=742054 RepID=A0A7X4YKR3_9BACL|nr:ATP-binding cassette domain-containing protein [Paenibacillus sacheonensis]MBM7563256.1 energy-coupling factor transport system ATP-binding protein [Paenibacillus sacheonensis]NBC68186.1 ATP-binding cassette domain-containing protein [Paenibacillus sacheonensis]